MSRIEHCFGRRDHAIFVFSIVKSICPISSVAFTTETTNDRKVFYQCSFLLKLSRGYLLGFDTRDVMNPNSSYESFVQSRGLCKVSTDKINICLAASCLKNLPIDEDT